jgi:hypothetical protein
MNVSLKGNFSRSRSGSHRSGQKASEYGEKQRGFRCRDRVWFNTWLPSGMKLNSSYKLCHFRPQKTAAYYGPTFLPPDPVLTDLWEPLMTGGRRRKASLLPTDRNSALSTNWLCSAYKLAATHMQAFRYGMLAILVTSEGSSPPGK